MKISLTQIRIRKGDIYIKVKKSIVLICILAVIVVAGLGAAFWIKPIRRDAQLDSVPIQQDKLELIGMADSKEEAEKLAEDYEIELISYSEKVAVFQTGKSYDEILKIGENKKLTELSINNTLKAF